METTVFEYDDYKNPVVKLGRARTIAFSGNHAQAASEVGELAQAKDLSPQMYYDLARLLSRSASFALKDGQLAQTERDKVVQNYAAQALQLLSKADDHCKDPAVRKQLTTEPDLEFLRGQKGFQKWIQSLDSATPSETKAP